MGASLWVGEVHHNQAGSRTWSEPQVRGAQLRLASRKGETYWKDTGDPEHRNHSRCKDLSDWTQEIRSHQLPLSLPHSFPSLIFVSLSLTTILPHTSAHISLTRVIPKERSSEKPQDTKEGSDWSTSDHVSSPRPTILAGDLGVL